MKNDIIQQVLQGIYADPDAGSDISVDCKAVIIKDTLDKAEARLLANLGPEFAQGAWLALISDRNTYEALGHRLARNLEESQMGQTLQEIILPGTPHADHETVSFLRGETRGATALVAVGSGTINDLCKYTANLDGKPFAVFGTAPSMNGYSSANASITLEGHKKSLAATTARGIFIDLTVFARAPKRLIQAGLGDSICRSTAQADWLLAHLLLDQPYRNAPFAMLAPFEDTLLRNSDELVDGGLATMEQLAKTLVLSGFGMTICGGSYPASQGEHLISHYIEMMGSDLPENFHGEQIAVTTLTMARLQEKVLAMQALEVSSSAPMEAELISHFGEVLGTSCWEEYAKKRLTETGAEVVNARLRDRWPTIRMQIRSVIRSSDELETSLKRAGCPTRPEDLGWDRDLYRAAVKHSREIRNRYTFLDLAGDAGLLEELDFI
jgi:glycerol-1-phosphate dehydrogenase [NAD(P)+]